MRLGSTNPTSFTITFTRPGVVVLDRTTVNGNLQAVTLGYHLVFKMTDAIINGGLSLSAPRGGHLTSINVTAHNVNVGIGLNVAIQDSVVYFDGVSVACTSIALTSVVNWSQASLFNAVATSVAVNFRLGPVKMRNITAELHSYCTRASSWTRKKSSPSGPAPAGQ